MFETVQPAPPDSILGLTEAFQNDPNPQKVNLSVGQFQDESGRTPVLNSVKHAEQYLLQHETSKSYLGIAGDREFNRQIPQLILGADHPALKAGRVATCQTPGGTGALRVVADFLHSAFPQKSLWLSNPTWPNHAGVFEAAGVAVQTYPYYDTATHGLDYPALREQVAALPRGDVILLHACCHNPTGVDLSDSQWEELSQMIADRGLLPLIDFAYQGFGEDLDADATGVRTLLSYVPEMLVCSSYSKNFGLYGERVGALTMIASDPGTVAAIGSRVKKCIRANYSNPPAHGGAIVATILAQPDLRSVWLQELAEMRRRIRGLRQEFTRWLSELGAPVDFSFLVQQKGMFSFSGLEPGQVDRLRNEYSIYMVRNGRMNVAGLSSSNLPRVCQAICEVLR